MTPKTAISWRDRSVVPLEVLLTPHPTWLSASTWDSPLGRSERHTRHYLVRCTHPSNASSAALSDLPNPCTILHLRHHRHSPSLSMTFTPTRQSKALLDPSYLSVTLYQSLSYLQPSTLLQHLAFGLPYCGCQQNGGRSGTNHV